MKLKKLTALAMTTAMCAASVFGCGGGDDEKETTGSGSATEKKDVALTVWSPAEDQESGWIQKMCEQFNTAHPEWNITFTYGTCGEGDAGKNVTTDVEEAGDVYFFASDQLPTLINNNAIAKLAGETAEYVKSTNTETMVGTVSKDGSIYGLPFTANTWFMYYDKSVFTEEDVKDLDKMLEKGVVSFPITDTWYFASFYAAGGATFCGPNGDNEADGVKLGDKATEVTNYLIDLIANKNFVKDESDSGIAGLGDKTVNAVFTGSWKYDAIKEKLGDNMGIVQCPNMKIGTMKSFAGSKAVGVNPTCKDQDVAVALARYLAGEEAQKAHYEMRNIIPCNTILAGTEAVKKDILAQAQNNTVANTSVVQPANDSFNANYWDNAKNFVTSLYDGTVTKENAAEKTAELENAFNGK